MKLARVRQRDATAGGPRPTRFALVRDDEQLSLLPQSWSFAQALELLSGENLEDAGGETAAADGWEMLAPAPEPVSLRDSVGFFQHIRNTRRSRGDVGPLLPVWHERPGFYFANPNALRSATDAVHIPPGSQRFDFELEIAAVVGRRGRDLSAAEAGEAIAGYVLFCDWSARDIQAEERTLAIGIGKGKDAANSLGPWILSAQEAASVWRTDGLDIPVSAHVNGRLMTDPGTRYIGMDWTFEEIVAYASIGVELIPGDLIAAGTVPTGCLLERSADDDFRGWLTAGDEVRLSAGPLGEIRSTILAGPPPAQWRRT
jgi:2-keto-4-pentenoate hydratase/2-oxohepta-3-ene-1,7-dioic acid hydratase in catechol pathway